MPELLVEENYHYCIDCRKAVWASDEIHDVYHTYGLPDILCDADFVIETEKDILLIEYKNANIPEAAEHRGNTPEFDPGTPKIEKKIISKFYDSLHYLRLMGKNKPVRYVFIAEYPKGDSTSRKLLRNRLMKKLPFALQQHFDTGIKLVESFDVMSISEWNADSLFSEYPIREYSKTGT